MNQEQFEEICFQIITFAGEARSSFVEALRHAKDADKSKARELLAEGNRHLIQAEKDHMQLIQQEAAGETVQVKMILTHAEDLMMSADTIHVLCEELISLL